MINQLQSSGQKHSVVDSPPEASSNVEQVEITEAVNVEPMEEESGSEVSGPAENEGCRLSVDPDMSELQKMLLMKSKTLKKQPEPQVRSAGFAVGKVINPESNPGTVNCSYSN